MADDGRRRLQFSWGELAAIAIGIAAYWLWTGFVLLDPSNILWLDKANGDPLMHTLGWWFWRDEPWAWPPGLNPRYGIELAGSIALSDSLPLFAFPLKLLRPWLPEVQQYWGAWLLLSMVLQGLFGYLLARALQARTVLALLATAFFCFAPPFLYRAQDHMALAGHWVVVAALWLYAIAPRRWWAWPLLVAACALVHAYLLAMVLAIWIASLAQRLWLGYPRVRLAAEFATGAALAAGLMWMAGFFVIGTADAWGLGVFRFNLLSPVDPQEWSGILSDIPDRYGDYEGFAYLGAGLIALVIVLVLTLGLGPLRRAVARRWLPLGGMLLLLVLFAIGPVVGLGPFDVLTLPLPGWLEKLWSIFRSTGRMAWPAYYFGMALVIVLVGRRLRLAIALPLVAVALVLQLADTFPGWYGFLEKRRETGTEWGHPLVSAFWAAAPSSYDRIREVPVRYIGHDWFTLSEFAVTHGMSSGSIYLGRTDSAVWEATDARALQIVQTGDFEPRTIYVVEPIYARWVARQVAPGDLFGTIDGRLVFARGGAALATPPGTKVLPYDATAPELTPGKHYDFAPGAVLPPFLVGGWEPFWRGGMLANEWRAAIQFRAPAAGPGAVLRLWLRGNSSAEGRPQSATFAVDAAPPVAVTIPDGSEATVDLPISAQPDGNTLVDVWVSEASGPRFRFPVRDYSWAGLIVVAMELVPAPN